MLQRYVATIGDRQYELSVELLDDGGFQITIDGRRRVLDARRAPDGGWSLIDRQSHAVRWVEFEGAAASPTVTLGGAMFAIRLTDARRSHATRLAPTRPLDGPQPIRAPMPGKVVKILVRPAEVVTAGQGLVIVEAMKMENELRAGRAGVVAEILVSEGVAVEAGQVMLTLQ